MQNSINQRDKINRKSSRKNKIKYIPLALAISLGMISCDKDDELAPIIKTKQSSISLENWESINPSDYFIVSDDEDPNPTILVDINDKAISYDQAYTFLQSGDFDMNCEARDMSGNMSSAKIKVNVWVWLPQLSWLENIQENINPKVDQELNLLAGIQATDIKDGDITGNIQVYIKNINQQREKIENPTNYIINYPWTIELKYQIQDIDWNNIQEIKTLEIPPKTWENINIPKMNIVPSDPGFTPSNIEYSGKYRFRYLDTLNIYQTWSMWEVMIRNWLWNMSSSEYIDEINNWQVIWHWTWPLNSDEIDGTFNYDDIYGGQHDKNVTTILCWKKNNWIWACWIIGPIIQTDWINKIQRIKDRWRNKLEEKLDNDKKNIIFVVSWKNTNDFDDISRQQNISSIRNLINSKKCIIFASGSNTINMWGIEKSKLRKEWYNDWDSRWAYAIPQSITGVQCIWWCQKEFQADLKDEYRDNWSQSRLVIGDPKDIRYSPANHAFESDWKTYSDISWASSYSTPSFTGLAYLIMMTNPSMTTDELLTKLNEYKKDVPVNYHIDPSQSYMSKTVDPSKAFTELIATVPTEVSLSSPDLIPITRNGYKFSIPHGDGIVKADWTPLSQDEIDNISIRWNLTQEEFFINPDELRKLGYKEWDTLTISVSVCSDSENNYEQIWDKTYDIKLLP